MNTNLSEALRGASDRVASAAHGAREAGRELLHSEKVRKGLDRAAAGLDRAAAKVAGHPLHTERSSPGLHLSPGEAVFVGVCAGGALAFLFDPSRGRTRRALIRDQVVHFGHKAGDAAAVAYRDTRNRAVGLAAEARGVLEGREPSDERLEMRARMALRGACSHPRAIDVEVKDGVVSVRGPVLSTEAENVVASVRRLFGVRNVVDELERHDSPGSVPALQGEGARRPANRISPATRAVLALGCASAAAPFVAKAVSSRQFLSVAPALLAGLAGLTALAVALQESSAQRHALEGDARPHGTDPSAAWEGV